MKLVVEIDIDNDAFHPDETIELARIFSEYALRLSRGDTITKNFRDINGNVVGYARLSKEEVNR